MTHLNNDTEKVMIDIIFMLNKLKTTQNELKKLIGSEGNYPANQSTK